MFENKAKAEEKSLEDMDTFNTEKAKETINILTKESLTLKQLTTTQKLALS